MKNIVAFVFSCVIVFESSAQNCAPASAYDYLEINNVKSRINNGGDM
ncbi:MAG: hypothetical protein WBB36_06515 [Chitinophagales bacterium]